MKIMIYTNTELSSISSPEEVRTLVGDKAAEMVSLFGDLRDLEAAVPWFIVFPASGLEPVYRNVDKVPSIDELPEIPTAQAIPPSAAELTRRFRNTLDRILSARDGHATVLRSSMIWPGNERPPGIDSTFVVPANHSSVDVGFPGSLYKAYTSMGLELDGISGDVTRRAGLIIMDLIPNLVWQGTAYATEDEFKVEVAPWGGSGSIRHFADRDEFAESNLFGSYATDRFQELVEGLTNIAKPAPGSCLEIEFLVDNSPDVLVLQRRLFEVNGGTFHTVGTYKGPVNDTRQLQRIHVDDVDGILHDSHSNAYVLPLLDDDRLDAFGLAWRARHLKLSAPSCLVLTAHSGSRSGMPSHIPWFLRRLFPETLLIVVPETQVPDTVNEVDISSDGTSPVVRWS